MFSEFDWFKLTIQSPAMLALIVFSIITLGIAIERTVYFWRRRGNPDDVARQVSDRLRRGEVKEAVWTCEHTPHPVGSVLRVVADSSADEAQDVDERIHVALSREKLLLERNLNVLGTMAGSAPLVGLLGTVWGIMRAFHDMAHVGSAAPSVVAAGIAEALVTTAIGLVVAVPALMLYNHFVRRSTVMLTMSENHARTIRSSKMSSGGSNSTPHASGSAKETLARPVHKPQPVGVS